MKKLIYLAIFTITLGGVVYFYTNKNMNIGTSDSHSNKQGSSKEDKQAEDVYVYETNAESADDCASFETYHKENGVCSFECADEQECVDMQNASDEEFADWSQELAKDKAPVEEKSIDSNDKSQKADYKVSTGEKIAFVSGKDADEYRKIWDEIRAISPDYISDKYIEEFQIFDNGKDDTLAFVHDDNRNGKWTIAVNIAGRKSSSERERKATIIHELGHILALNISQINPDIKEANCKTYMISEGCANTNSYVYSFKKTFWKNSDKEQEYIESKFVTEYAASEPLEDLAESFAFFVLGKGQTVLGESVRDQKIKMFYNYPELVQIREEMRKSLSTEIVRARKMSQSR